MKKPRIKSRSEIKFKIEKYLHKMRQNIFAENQRKESVFTRPNNSIMDVDSV